MFKIFYNVMFVSGNLSGLDSEMSITYPNSSRNRVEAQFKKDIEEGRVFKGIASHYIILNYHIEEIEE